MAKSKGTGKKAAPNEGASRPNLKPLVDDWVKALKVAQALRAGKQRESAECDVCLASRSCFFDFHTWTVIHGELDPWAEKELAQLFQHSVEALHLPDYKKSVELRRKEFLKLCRMVKAGQPAGSVSSIGHTSI